MRKRKTYIYVVTIIRWADHENEKVYEQHAFKDSADAERYLAYEYDNYHREDGSCEHGITLETWRKSFYIDYHDARLTGEIHTLCLEDDEALLHSLI